MLLLALAMPCAQAQDHFLTLTLEDDLLADRDYGYTGGTQLTWGHGGERDFGPLLPAWLARLSAPLWLARNPAQTHAVTLRLGLQAFTPEDLGTPTPPPDDLPYTGLAYVQGTLHANDAQVADRASLLLGLVGPDSGVASVQKGIHRVTHSDRPEGWGTQLNDRAVFKLGVARKWRTANHSFAHSAWGMDLITLAELGAGSLESTADLGLSLRLGTNLLRSFPTASLLPGRDVNILAGQPQNDINYFVAVVARYQPNAIYVQGHSDGPELRLMHEQRFISAGISGNRGDWGFQYALAHGSRLFDGPHASQTFGSFSVTLHY